MGMDASKIPLGQEASRRAIETCRKQRYQCPAAWPLAKPLEGSAGIGQCLPRPQRGIGIAADLNALELIVQPCAGVARRQHADFEMPAQSNGKVEHEPRLGIVRPVGQRRRGNEQVWLQVDESQGNFRLGWAVSLRPGRMNSTYGKAPPFAGGPIIDASQQRSHNCRARRLAARGGTLGVSA